MMDGKERKLISYLVAEEDVNEVIQAVVESGGKVIANYPASDKEVEFAKRQKIYNEILNEIKKRWKPKQ